MRALVLVVIIFSSVCFAQSEIAVIELYNGEVYTYSSSEIKSISVAVGLVSADEEQTLNTIVNSFVLHQNFPNPFNPATTIKYEIPHPGLVEVKIYNIQGELIRSLSNTFRERGIHTINWDSNNEYGSPVSSGAYFCQITYNNTFLTKKMLLIR